MKKPEIPLNEPERLAALCSLDVLDTPAEARFDRITRVAQRLFHVPIALVSLVDAGRQWFKSRQGLAATETPRDISFCAHAILADDIFHVPNALEDPRFADNPLVTRAPHIRFYAGAPLHAPGGERVGTLCIIDGRPRELSATDLAMLRDLADITEAELERASLRETQIQLRSAGNRLRAVIDTVVDGIVTIDGRGVVCSFNPAAERIFGYAAADVLGRNVSMLMPEPYHSAHDGYLHNYLSTGKRRIIGIGREVTGRRRDGSTFPMDLAVSEMEINGEREFTGIVRDISARKQAEAALREANDLLETRVRARTAQLTRANEALRSEIGERTRVELELHAQSRELHDMSRRLLEAQESERRTINRELHDRIGQNLSVLNLNLKLLSTELSKDRPRAPVTRLDDMQKLLEATTAQVRDVMADLRPPALDDYGLFAALRVHAESLGARINTPVSVVGGDLAPRPASAVEMALFRIAQETLANTAKHARAKRVEVTLAATAERVTLTIADDGVGFDVANGRSGQASWGLAVMRERAEAIGGVLRLESAPGRGTRVSTELVREPA